MFRQLAIIAMVLVLTPASALPAPSPDDVPYLPNSIVDPLLFGDRQAYAGGTPPETWAQFGWSVHAAACRHWVLGQVKPLVGHPVAVCFENAESASVVRMHDVTGFPVGALVVLFSSRWIEWSATFCGEQLVDNCYLSDHAKIIVYPMDPASSLEFCGIAGASSGFVTRSDAPAITR